MVSVRTVQHSINLEFLCTYKSLKMFLYTLFKKKWNLQIFIYKKLCMKLYLNDEKAHVDPCSHHDIFWGLKALCDMLKYDGTI